MRAWLVCILLSLSKPVFSAAHAYAVVTSSSLNRTLVDANTPSEVVLRFNTSIEPSLSKFFLVSAGDGHDLVNAHPGAQPGEMVLQLNRLPAGAYAIHYKVFAADGHLSEKYYHFNVSKK